MSDLPILFHVVAAPDIVWNAHDRYCPPSLAQEGFLHASFRDKVAESAQLYFKEEEMATLRVLAIDPRKLDCEVRIVDTPRGPMPHIHGSVPRVAVTEISLEELLGR